jgi:hypothetical protein
MSFSKKHIYDTLDLTKRIVSSLKLELSLPPKLFEFTRYTIVLILQILAEFHSKSDKTRKIEFRTK